MFAVFEDGSHQYRVKSGDKLKVDYRVAAKKGDALTFDRVLAAGNNSESKIGRPLIEGATVVAEVVDEEVRGPKLEVGKFKRRKAHIRHNGHTQRYTGVRITAVNVPGLVADEPAAAAAPAAAPDAAPSVPEPAPAAAPAS